MHYDATHTYYNTMPPTYNTEYYIILINSQIEIHRNSSLLVVILTVEHKLMKLKRPSRTPP